MKYLFNVVMLWLIVSCGSSRVRETPTMAIGGPEGLKGVLAVPVEEDTVLFYTDKVNPVVNFSNAERIGGIMNFLASDDLRGRDSGSEGIDVAAGYIETIFVENGIEPYFTTYKDTLLNYSKEAYNIVGYIPGVDGTLKNEYVIIGAHYDHIGIVPGNTNDSIANGANDNASGTSTVLELARYFGISRTNKRSVLFVLFSAEEKGLLGSRHLANKLKAQGLDLYTMLNFEMTGVPMTDKDYLLYITGYERSNLAEISNKYARENLIGFLPTAKGFNLFQRSDNYPFHEVFNVPSQTYVTFDFTNFNQYHKVGDEVAMMDFSHMANVVNKMIPVLQGIINAPTKEIKYN